MINKKLTGKIVAWVCTILTVLIAVFTVYIFVSVIVAKTKDKPVNIFGVSFSVVLTDSMEPEIMTGDLILVKNEKFSSVKAGDNILFKAGEGFSEVIRGKYVVHKAIEITEFGIQTKGVHNTSADKTLVTEENFAGICVYNSAFWGKIFSFVSKYAFVIIIAIVTLVFVVTQVRKIIKLAKAKDGAEGELPQPPEADSGETTLDVPDNQLDSRQPNDNEE